GLPERGEGDAAGMEERVVDGHAVAHLDAGWRLAVGERGASEVGDERGRHPRLDDLEVGDGGRVRPPALPLHEEDEPQASGAVEGEDVLVAVLLALLLAEDLEQPLAHLAEGVAAVLLL